MLGIGCRYLNKYINIFGHIFCVEQNPRKHIVNILLRVLELFTKGFTFIPILVVAFRHYCIQYSTNCLGILTTLSSLNGYMKQQRNTKFFQL
jgi:hypothetical protein